MITVTYVRSTKDSTVAFHSVCKQIGYWNYSTTILHEYCSLSISIARWICTHRVAMRKYAQLGKSTSLARPNWAGHPSANCRCQAKANMAPLVIDPINRSTCPVGSMGTSYPNKLDTGRTHGLFTNRRLHV